MTARVEARATLAAMADRPDDEIDLAEAALALSVLGPRMIDPAPYRDHLAEIAAQIAAEVGAARPGARGDRVATLNSVILDRLGYHGDTETYDDLDNADLARVIDRRKGLPVALGILYLHAARAQGWGAAGLAFPGHFVIRLDLGDAAQVIDPFHGGNVLDAAGLRGLLKATSGIEAELEPEHWQPVGNRDVLVRLQNNVRTRCVQGGDIERALGAVEATLLFAPDLAQLWREAGVLNIKLDNLRAAIDALEHYVAKSGAGPARDDAERLLSQIRRRLN